MQNGGETGIDCGGPCPNVCADSALNHTKKFYVSFYYDGQPVVFQSDTDYVSQDPTGAQTIVGNVTTSAGLSGPYATFTFDVVSQSLDATDLITLSPSNYYFESTSSTVNCHLKILEANGTGGTTYQSSPQDSTNQIFIENAIIDNVGKTPQGNNKVLFTGKFTAKMVNTNTGVIHTITKGTFGVDFGSIH
jgi:hypothetical protein